MYKAMNELKVMKPMFIFFKLLCFVNNTWRMKLNIFLKMSCIIILIVKKHNCEPFFHSLLISSFKTACIIFSYGNFENLRVLKFWKLLIGLCSKKSTVNTINMEREPKQRFRCFFTLRIISRQGCYTPSVWSEADTALAGKHFLEEESEPFLEQVEPGGTGMNTKPRTKFAETACM